MTATVGNMATAMCQLQGVKDVTATDFDMVSAVNGLERAQQLISRRTARILLALSAEGKLPSWVIRNVDFEMVRLAAK